jgi:hypothetical protein
MYANLKVYVSVSADEEDEPVGHDFYAYAVEIVEDELVIGLDGQNGNGSYAEPVGTVKFPLKAVRKLDVQADF